MSSEIQVFFRILKLPQNLFFSSPVSNMFPKWIFMKTIRKGLFGSTYIWVSSFKKKPAKIYILRVFLDPSKLDDRFFSINFFLGGKKKDTPPGNGNRASSLGSPVKVLLSEGQTCGRSSTQEIGITVSPFGDPWDWYIQSHGWLIFMVFM